jgi:hypothetical protein
MAAGGTLLREREVRAQGLRAAAQDHRVARLHAERRGVHRDVRPGLVDDRDHTEWNPHAPHTEPVRPHAELAHRADRIRQRRDLAEPIHQRGPLVPSQLEAPQQRRGEPARRGIADVGAVRVQDPLARGLEPFGGAEQPAVLALRVEVREPARGVACVARQGFDAFAEVHLVRL